MDAAVGSSMYGVLMIETTIIRELIPHIDATYRTIASKEGRAVQGGSGGGLPLSIPKCSARFSPSIRPLTTTPLT
jgi:hypothetical protein